MKKMLKEKKIDWEFSLPHWSHSGVEYFDVAYYLKWQVKQRSKYEYIYPNMANNYRFDTVRYAFFIAHSRYGP